MTDAADDLQGVRMTKRHTRTFEITGWLLFVVCAALFIVAGVRDRDMVTLAASIVFLGACIVFLIPLVFRGTPPTDEREGE